MKNAGYAAPVYPAFSEKEKNMTQSIFFRSLIEQENSAVVICDVSHKIVYMNPCAERQYAKRGGASLMGKSLLDCHSPESQEKIRRVVDWFRSDATHNRVFIAHNQKHNRDSYMVALRDGSGELIGYAERQVCRTPEESAPYCFCADEKR